jgi:threonine/homoserine/homoserine lactone efflux protein
MNAELWVSFCVLELVLCLTPGPAVLFVTTRALAGGMRPGMLAAAGILTGNLIYFILSATGVAALIVASAGLFTALKWVGAVYLLWTGLQLLRPKALVHTDATADSIKATPAGNEWVRGTLVQLANPKALIFFLALLPQFIELERSIVWQMCILAISSLLIEWFVLSGYTALGARLRSLGGQRFERLIERVGGLLLVALGLKLAVEELLRR